MCKDYIERYMQDAANALGEINHCDVAWLIGMCKSIRATEGRVFFLGVGGSAANASHAVNDFRKIAGIECYAPTDNVAELTARTNDDSWEETFVPWLKTSRLGPEDAIFVLSVGGGSPNTSANIVAAVDYANAVGAAVLGIVSRDGGYTKQHGEAVVVIPPQSDDTITPLAESFQALIWHLAATALGRDE